MGPCSQSSGRESTPEVGAPDGGVVQQVIPAAGEKDPAGLEDVRAIGDREGAQRVLLDEKDRGAVAVDLCDGGENLVHHLGR